MKFSYWFLIAFLSVAQSCARPPVYKIVQKDIEVDLPSKLKSETIFVKEMEDVERNFDTKNVKSKLIYYLQSKGYRVCERYPPFPRYVVHFSWKVEREKKSTVVPIYKAGKTTYSSGSLSGYNGSYSYSGTSTDSGTFDYMPCAYNVYTASLIIFVADMQNALKDKSCKTVWSTSVFLHGEEAYDINKEIDYLIVAAIDRFGQGVEGSADKYEFCGNEKEIKMLREYNKGAHEIHKRRLSE